MNFKVCFFLLTFFLLHSAYASADFLTVSDIHYGSENKSLDGEDTGPDFLKVTMHQFKKLGEKSDFIIFLGDIPTHSLFNSTKKAEYEKTVFHELYVNDKQAKPMFYIPGNNDSLQGNYQPFESNGVSPLNFAKNWDGACVHCKSLIIDDKQMRSHGYYSSYVMPNNKNIILMALNATQWTKTPLLSRYPNQEQDAEQQLHWLEQQLKQHHAQQLLIAMHEPPGNNYKGQPIWHQRYLNQFIKILEQNSHSYKQITLLTSHSHMDELRKIHLNNGTNIYAYSTPGISRLHHNNPGMKIFHLNDTLNLKDFTTYYTSDLHQWSTQKYNAVGEPNAIFPHCQNKILAECQNQLTLKQVCHDLDHGLFYGVKSPRVKNTACQKIYKIN